MFKSTIIAVLAFFILSCKHDVLHLSLESKKIGSNIDIEALSFLTNDTIFLCGGIKSQSGQIFRSCDGGVSWQKIFECNDKLYSMYFFSGNNEALAVGDCTHVQKSYDRGVTWSKKVDCSYLWTNDRTSFRKVYFYDNQGGIAIGNQNREHGNAMFSWDRGESWNDVQGPNGLNDWWIFNNDSILAVGYGIVEEINHNWQKGYFGYLPKVSPYAFTGDYFTGVWFTSSAVGYMSGFNGGIYKSTDGGHQWKDIRKSNSLFTKNVHFNDILFETESIGWICGVDGVLMKTSDAGNSWQKVETNTSSNLKNMVYQNASLYITSENGTYFVLKE